MKGTNKVTYLKAVQQAKAIKEATDRDPHYQALRLRGLAGLLRATEEGTLGQVTNLNEVVFFVASVVDDIAEALSPDVSGQ